MCRVPGGNQDMLINHIKGASGESCFCSHYELNVQNLLLKQIHWRWAVCKPISWIISVLFPSHGKRVKQQSCPSSGSKCSKRETDDEERGRERYKACPPTVVSVLLQGQNRWLIHFSYFCKDTLKLQTGQKTMWGCLCVWIYVSHGVNNEKLTCGWYAWQDSGRLRIFWDLILSHFTDALCRVGVKEGNRSRGRHKTTTKTVFTHGAVNVN